MTDKQDITERLRNPLWVHSYYSGVQSQSSDASLDRESVVSDMKEAADEIEKLRSTIMSQDAKLLASWPIGAGPIEAQAEIMLLQAKVADLEGYYGPVPDRNGSAFTAIKDGIRNGS